MIWSAMSLVGLQIASVAVVAISWSFGPGGAISWSFGAAGGISSIVGSAAL